MVFSKDFLLRARQVVDYYSLSEAEKDLLPTEEQIKDYNALGFYKSNKIFSDSEIDQVVAAQDRFYTVGGKKFETKDQAGMIKTDYARQEIPELNNFMRKPLFAAVGAMLCGEPVRLWHDQLLSKSPSQNSTRKATVGWHTDAHYWQSNRAAHFGHKGAQMLTGWVPLHDVGVKEGSLIVIPQSHLSDSTGIDDILDFFSNDTEKQEHQFSGRGIEMKKHTMILKKGEVSFHHVNTIHGSGENQSDKARRSVAIHLQPLSGTYDPIVDYTGKLAVHPMMNLGIGLDASGKPDFADPEWCPELGFV